MTDDEPELPGFAAFVFGVKATAVVALLVLVLKYGQGVAEGYVLLAALADQETATAVTGFVVLLLVVTILLLAVPLYASLHTAEVEIAFPVGGVTVEPGLFQLPDLVYLIPPVLLAWAGYRKARAAAEPTLEARLISGGSVVVGYLLLAVVTIVPSAWLFEAVIDGLVLSEVPGATGSVRLLYRNPVRAHLVVGVVYPVVFGAVGGLVAHVAADEAAPDRRAPTGTDAGESTLRYGDRPRDGGEPAPDRPGTGDAGERTRRAEPAPARLGDDARERGDRSTPDRSRFRDDARERRSGEGSVRDQPRESPRDGGPAAEGREWGPASRSETDGDRPRD